MTDPHLPLDSWLPAVNRLARQAGDAIRAVAASGLGVATKGDGSPVTRADLAAHACIAAGLPALAPVLPVISEESWVDSGARPPVYWCVDPLDGTKEFVRGLADYTVNIAVVAHGRPLLGVILLPATGVLYTGIVGSGAWRQAAADRPAAPLSPCRGDRPLTAVISRSHSSPETEAYLRRLGVAHGISRGSSLKFCAVAEGQADLYPRLGPTCFWDTAAGTAICRAAGCRVLALDGTDLHYDLALGIKHPGFLVAGPRPDLPDLAVSR